MANCNGLILNYSNNLNISKKKKDKLRDSKNFLQDKITSYFKKNHPDYIPEFYIQGSYKMKTMILTKDNECDLDYGVYFKRDVDVTGTTLQKWVKKALKDVTSIPTEHRKKCIRVKYKAEYHIDFPVYYFPDDCDHPLLAVKDDDLQESDPREVVDWYNSEKDENGQLNRIVKYLKGWGDYKRNKMPSGLAMTILATENIQYNDRDDIALKDTLIAIHNTLLEDFECKVPGTPYDDLFADYDSTRMNNFLDNLDSFVDDAIEAVENESNQRKASKLWRKHLGRDKFPLGEDVDVDAKEVSLRKTSKNILTGTAYSQKDGSISNNSSGVKNKIHTNFGG
ncbi:hypothetical protein GCM10011344_26840 [Dokdonia pacifica]|uniref:Cyclic GMP-AMP synthase n=1 Tax=Dokdonia pacifica TaxID=1627892 RepID=A0A239DYN7_9FLAO|nr:hypothetical protein [Dokdonia pacifica]GGG24806.1 hypothetical protein GCM10011344_26840 [Dokdonia pacifica]SNS37605.1 hypothetical protein SAMN06265376_11312 [Dokdonia pacifica]